MWCASGQGIDLSRPRLRRRALRNAHLRERERQLVAVDGRAQVFAANRLVEDRPQPLPLPRVDVLLVPALLQRRRRP
eukprot:2045579-Rhodomonas_salina.3